jgi:hypothetical protein
MDRGVIPKAKCVLREELQRTRAGHILYFHSFAM